MSAESFSCRALVRQPKPRACRACRAVWDCLGSRVYHIEQRCEKIEEKLSAAGARIPACGLRTAIMPHSPAFLRLVNDAKTRIREVAVNDVRRSREACESFYLIDVREDSEWNAGRAAGAIHLGKGIIERDIENTVPDKEAKLVLYCGGGFRSALAAEALQKMSYTNVFSLAGGWRAWKEAGLPVES